MRLGGTFLNRIMIRFKRLTGEPDDRAWIQRPKKLIKTTPTIRSAITATVARISSKFSIPELRASEEIVQFEV
jgi:hypothetical protein